MALCILGWSNDAEAQYKNGQIGFEGGYMFLGSNSGLDNHGVLLGLRGAYKGSEHWWVTARAGVSLRGETFSDRTVVLFHLVPAAVRYYFFTDRFRPFLGVSNSFQFLANNTTDSTVYWGPGATAGAEFRLRRDLFIGFQLDAFYMFVFQGPDVPLITSTIQLNFFL